MRDSLDAIINFHQSMQLREDFHLGLGEAQEPQLQRVEPPRRFVRRRTWRAPRAARSLQVERSEKRPEPFGSGPVKRFGLMRRA